MAKRALGRIFVEINLACKGNDLTFSIVATRRAHVVRPLQLTAI
jgi:hypothetical protein